MLEFKQIFGHEGYLASKPLREEVFIGEQGYSNDYDAHDDEAWHIVGYERGALIGTARMYRLTERTYEIGRVAVKKEYRRSYIGDLMMKTLQDKIVGLGGCEAIVSAVGGTENFYIFEGYEVCGKERADGIIMKKDLTKPCRHCQAHQMEK